MIQDIGVYVICVAAIAGGCYLIVRLGRRSPTAGEVARLADDAELYLRLNRLVEEGEKRLAAYDSMGHNAGAALKSTAELQRWHDDALELFRKQYFAYWTHFDNIDNYGSHGVDAGREQVVTLLRRLRGLIEWFRPATPTEERYAASPATH